MYKSRALCVSACLAAVALLAHCTPKDNAPSGTGGSSTPMGGSSSVSNGGAGAAGSNGGVQGTGGSSSGGSSVSAGGTKAAGGASNGGTSGGSNGGAGGSSGGSKATGGSTPAGGANGGAGGGASSGGAQAGGTSGGSSAPSTGGTTTDSSGIPLAKPGDSTTTSNSYLNLGEMRLINNRWGADARNCSGATYKVFVANDGSIGYDFNRPACGGDKGYPDYPEIEFGVAPFGRTSKNRTSPAFSSTTLLPMQIKSLTSAKVTIENFNHNFQSGKYWDSNFEFWISKNNPATSDDGGVYAEVIIFLGWNGDRMSSPNGWPCDKSGTVTAGSNSYYLCHQSDTWSNGQWRFFNFNVNNGPVNPFSGTADVKALLDFVMSKYNGFNSDMWLTRIEVGTEIDDNTSGSATIKNLSFEINGSSRSIQLAK